MSYEQYNDDAKSIMMDLEVSKFARLTGSISYLLLWKVLSVEDFYTGEENEQQE